MTIPLSNWCPECADTCSDHTSICTTCGTELTTPPRRQPPLNPTNLLPTLGEVLPAATGFSRQRLITRLIADEEADVREISIPLAGGMFAGETDAPGIANLATLLGNLNEEITDLHRELMGIGLVQTSVNENGNGVPQDALNELPRVALTERSAVLKEAALTVLSENGDTCEIECVPAEFGAIQVDLSNLRCIVRDRTTRLNATDDVKDSIVVLRRGEIAFAQKAREAQQKGALGVVIVNDRPSPWPYVMTDSTNNSSDITIPTVMVPQGTMFPNTEFVKASLKIQDNNDLTCCVCTETFCNTTVIQLPKCNHRFHEACALTWLSSHNSCPYCRSVVYSKGVSATVNNGSQDVSDAFYG